MKAQLLKSIHKLLLVGTAVAALTAMPTLAQSSGNSDSSGASETGARGGTADYSPDRKNWSWIGLLGLVGLLGLRGAARHHTEYDTNPRPA